MRIAVVGSGISGLGAAWLLAPNHEVHLYEQDSRFGGHSRTLEVRDGDRQIPVDTGFIVFNHRNYPLLTRLFEGLQVPVEKSCMSFGVSIDRGWLEYGSKSLRATFGQWGNLLRPGFWRMVRDIRRFNRLAPQYVERNPRASLQQCMKDLRLGHWFRDYYLLAMGSAIWSTAPRRMLEFPAVTLVRFFRNHGLLDTADHLQWYTVTGGSRVYVKRLLERLPPAQQHLNVQVRLVDRQPCGVVLDVNGKLEQFDQLVLACHSDQALALLGDLASPKERQILGAIHYQPNEVILHRDASFMPRRRACWQSWVYLRESSFGGEPRVSLSYWMNNLQNLPTQHPVLVTLNPDRQPDPSLVLDRWQAHHPRFDQAAIDAQARLGEIQGPLLTWFCGAWTGYGFHEDGLRSANAVAEAIGIDAARAWIFAQ